MKKKLIFVCLIIFTGYILIFPQDAVAAAATGLNLWYEKILPTLLPFAILSYILIHSGYLQYINRLFAPILCRLFPVSDNGAFILLSGFLFGFPMGSKNCAELLKCGKIDKKESDVLFVITNNISPVFISSYILCQQLQMPSLIIISYLVLYLPPLIIGEFLLRGADESQCALSSRPTKIKNPLVGFDAHERCRLRQNSSPRGAYESLRTLSSRPTKIKNPLAGFDAHERCRLRQNSSPRGAHISRRIFCNTENVPASGSQMNFKIIDAGIMNGFETLTRLGGYIMLFSMIASITQKLPLSSQTRLILTGIAEITNGINLLPASIESMQWQYILAMTFTAFGGLSGIAQTSSMIKDTGLSLKNYCVLKLLLAGCSLILAWCVTIWFHIL